MLTFFQMADNCVNIINPVVERLVDRAARETSYLCCFSCTAAEFEKEKVKLEVKLETLQQAAEVATRQDEEIYSDVKHWMGEAAGIIVGDTTTRKNCFFGSILLSRSNLTLSVIY